MTMEKFNDILNYAIERENEAAEFYRYMQDLVKFEIGNAEAHRCAHRPVALN